MTEHHTEAEIDRREKMAAEVHQVYCKQYEKNFSMPYHTHGDFSELDEKTKDYDRALVEWHLGKVAKLEAERDRHFQLTKKLERDYSESQRLANRLVEETNAYRMESMAKIQFLVDALEEIADTGCGMSHPDGYQCCLVESGVTVEAKETIYGK